MSLGARLRMAQGDLGKALERAVVVDLAAAQHAAVTVGGVFAHAYVGDEVERGVELPQAAQALLHDAVLRPGGGALRVLMRGQAEQQHTRNARTLKLFHKARQFVRRIVVLPGQRGDFAVNMLALSDENRVNQAVWRDARFPHHAAQAVTRAQAARAYRLV